MCMYMLELHSMKDVLTVLDLCIIIAFIARLLAISNLRAMHSNVADYTFPREVWTAFMTSLETPHDAVMLIAIQLWCSSYIPVRYFNVRSVS